LAIIIIPIALVFIIQKAIKVDYGRGISQSVSEQKSKRSNRTPPAKNIIHKASQEKSTSQNRPKVLVSIPAPKDENKSDQSDPTSESEEKKKEQYISLTKLIPKETYSYKYSPSKPEELIRSTPKIESVEKSESKSSAQHSSPKSSEVQQILRDIQTEYSGEKLIITILANSPIKAYHSFKLDSPPRYVIDLYGRWSISKTLQPNNTNGLVKGIRFGLHQEKLRFVLDLKTDLSLEPTIVLSSTSMGKNVRN
jgi:hypothetical protein